MIYIYWKIVSYFLKLTNCRCVSVSIKRCPLSFPIPVEPMSSSLLQKSTAICTEKSMTRAERRSRQSGACVIRERSLGENNTITRYVNSICARLYVNMINCIDVIRTYYI